MNLYILITEKKWRKTMKKRLITTLMTITTLFAALPTTTWASTQTIDPADNQSFEVVASANVTDEDLAELGLNVVVSFPVEITLSIDGTKAFSGSDKVYAYGIMDSDKTLSVTIDTSNESYGKVKYRAKNSNTSVDSATNFFATVNETLSKESFSAEETKDNYLAQREGNAMVNYAELDISIQNLIPTFGTGTYYTNVPLRIAVQ